MKNSRRFRERTLAVATEICEPRVMLSAVPAQMPQQQVDNIDNPLDAVEWARELRDEFAAQFQEFLNEPFEESFVVNPLVLPTYLRPLVSGESHLVVESEPTRLEMNLGAVSISINHPDDLSLAGFREILMNSMADNIGDAMSSAGESGELSIAEFAKDVGLDVLKDLFDPKIEDWGPEAIAAGLALVVWYHDGGFDDLNKIWNGDFELTSDDDVDLFAIGDTEVKLIVGLESEVKDGRPLYRPVLGLGFHFTSDTKLDIFGFPQVGGEWFKDLGIRFEESSQIDLKFEMEF